MKLRKKTLFIIGAALCGLNVILYTTTRVSLLRDFQQLEYKYVKREVDRALEGLERTLSELNAAARDYAEQEGIYSYLQTAGAERLGDRQVKDNFDSLRLNLLLVLDRQGSVVYRQGYDFDRGREVAIPSSLLSHLKPDSPLLVYTNPNASMTGIVNLPDRLLMLSARPILNRRRSGTGQDKILGTVVVGRYLNEAEIANLGERTKLSLDIRKIDDWNLPDDFQTAGSTLLAHLPTADFPSDSGSTQENTPADMTFPPEVRGENLYCSSMHACIAIGYPSMMRGKRGETVPLWGNGGISPPPTGSREGGSAQAEYISGYALLRDIYNHPAMLLRVDFPRDIYLQGQVSIHYFTLLLLGVGLAFGCITFVVVERVVLSRLAHLNRSVHQVGASGDPSMRVSVKGRDELWGLADTINAMLAALERSHRERTTSEERYRLMAENSTDLIARQTTEGIFLYASPAAHTLLGYQPEELVGRSIYEFVHPQDLDGIHQSYATVLDGLVTATIGYRIRHKQGNYVWFETTSRAVRNPLTRRVRELVAVSRDITERKRVEEDL
ncbi:MAG: PAS domain S-box protein, partial [Coleofasciculaceae cyanobacterium SM2_3_26]|nr:PAS domain S-box protein [Coleofasciculaceae cyanobacterium SM2_3_26]